MDYYELWISEGESSDWNLCACRVDENREMVDLWAYTRCEWIDPSLRPQIAIENAGFPVDFNLAGFNIPVVSADMGEIAERCAPDDIQRIRVSLQASGAWEILNVLAMVDCLDHSESIIDYHPDDPSDPFLVDPEQAGKPRGVRKLALDSSRIGGREIFRIKDWMIPIIVSEKVKDAFQAAEMTGVVFPKVEVT